jgi:Carboxypeptidase regulatory-like domain
MSVTLGGPAYGYNGPTVMKVYIDTIYHTFAFALVPVELEEVGVKGTVVTAAGKPPMPPAEVILVENRTRHRTFTNAKGEFTFFGNISGPATVQAAGITQAVPQLRSPARSVDIRVP